MNITYNRFKKLKTFKVVTRYKRQVITYAT
jgi:hypothetical protein